MSATDPTLSIDEHNPWLGLASFTEETRAFFYGREEEVAELERRVKRKLLTVLFGKSGLGKTSILRAGLVPRLRARGYFPVYLRIDYGRDSPEAAEQIKQAIGHAAATGEWSQTGGIAAGESIWEFLHHRDAVLKDTAGGTLIPLLIFDQFEELFTLAQSDEFGRTRAARFIEELADLVENRPPTILEEKLEADEQAVERFDFSRSDYRVVIALREDYLAPLESLKKLMPSLAQNRLRLAPMTGTQALQAVLGPGKQLVSEEVAEAIVRFVAGDAELANAEVEPSLLSLICRELNEQRIAQGRAEISLDLLAGSHESILGSFYERSLADQPTSVRRIIEDELLTESGYRENLAEETLLHRLQVAGAAPDALTKLVNRRLLRIEERLDMRRVELTHDVLSAVVKASRDQRHEREAREATQRTLAEQRERELATRKALRRARAIATGCTVLAAVALTAAALAIVNVQRARRAEADAQQTRLISEQARGQAEGLLGFLTDDFVRELSSFGRYQVITELSQREINYFNALPASLKDSQTVRSGALALVNQADALLRLGEFATAYKSADDAVTSLEQLRKDRDRSETTTIALGLALTERGWVGSGRLGKYDADFTQPVELLRPLAERPGSSAQARRAYMTALIGVTFADGFLSNHPEDAARAGREAQRLAIELGARRQVDATLDADYATAGSWLVNALVGAGHNEEARRVGQATLTVADRVLMQRPQFGVVLSDKQSIEASLARVAANESDPATALQFDQQSMQSARAMLDLEPRNSLYTYELSTTYASISGDLWALGRLREALEYSQKALDEIGPQVGAGGAYVVVLVNMMSDTAGKQAQLENFAGAASTLAAAETLTSKLLGLGKIDDVTQAVFEAGRASTAAGVAYERDELGAVRTIVRDGLTRFKSVRVSGGVQTLMLNYTQMPLFYYDGQAAYALGDFASSARSEQSALQAARGVAGNNFGDQRMQAQIATWLSMSLAAQGKRQESAQTIGPVVAMYRKLIAKNHGDQWLALELASALYAQSLSDDHQRSALLREAAQRMDQLMPSIAALHDTRQWRERVRQAQARLGHGAT
jgi:hypothetical protein